MAAIFAQLIIGGQNYGVHAFVVPIRNFETHKSLDGVVIGDNGSKSGVNGIDNGFLIFKNYRVPYDSLLDKLSQITPDGKFKSSIKNKDKRFGLMLSGLFGGRLGLISCAELAARNALTIAIRYSAIRKQFGGDVEKSILDYQLHRYRLMPHLARCFASNMATKLLFRLYNERVEIMQKDPESPEANELHSLITLFKANNSWANQKALQECRECCGGHGYSSYSGFSKLRADNDIHLTWEGDNNVIIQQTARFLLKAVQSLFKGNPIKSQFLTFIQLEATKPKFESKDQLKNTLFLISLFEYRTNYYLSNALLKLQENGKTAADMTSAWNNTQVHHMLSLSKSFGEMLLVKELVNFTRELSQQCQATGEVMMAITLLYANHVLEQEHGPFVTHMTEEQARWINETTVELCDEVGESSVKIIDAIAIPDSVIASALGHSDGQMYQRYSKVVEAAKGCYDQPSWLNLIHESRKAIN